MFGARMADAGAAMQVSACAAFRRLNRAIAIGQVRDMALTGVRRTV
jgi:hypothetical protein